MTCYVHNVSPLKKRLSSNRKFFNCTIQSKDKVICAVCFSPNKHAQFTTIEATKSPVKLDDFTYSVDQSDDLVINRNTTATPISAGEAEFTIAEELRANAPVTIASLQRLAPEQLVDFKAQVCSVSAVKTLVSQRKRSTKKTGGDAQR